MRKLLLLCFLVMGGIGLASAQDRKVTGKVTAAEDGTVLPGVTVQLKGSNKGTQTDANGNYSLAVPSGGGMLVFSFVGMIAQQQAIGNKSIVNAALAGEIKQLSELVVTAFGISKATKALGYSTERVDATKLQQKQEPDVLRALQGKIPGVNIIGSNGVAGSATKINIRGTNTFFGNSQPLFVVDGIPYDNTENTSGGSRLSDGNGAYSNRAADIDPNNIASMTVLKGGAAAALYGTRASNGVILITTKTGAAKRSQKGLEISVGSSYSMEEVSGLPNYQNLYGTGSQNLAANANGSWGAPFGSVGNDSLAVWPAYGSAFPALNGTKVAYRAYPNNVKDFFRTGGLFENTIGITGGSGDKTVLSAVISNTKQNSYIPNNDFGRVSISVGGRTQLDNKLSVSGNLTYTNTTQSGPLLGGDNASSLFARTLYMGRSWPLQALPYSNPLTNASVFFVSAAQADNPLWSVANNSYKSNVDRLATSFNFTYDILPWLTANYKAGLNTYTDARQTTIRPGSAGAGSLGRITLDNIRFQEIESNFFLSGNRKLSPMLDLTATAGINWNQRTTDRNSTVGNEILFFGIDNYNLTNTQVKNSDISLPFSRRRIYGVYGDVTLAYRNSLFLNVTARNDWSSTLPAANRSFLYPSASVSWNFSDDIEALKGSILSAGKIRASISKVGRDASPYSLYPTYTINPQIVNPNSQAGIQFPFNGVAGSSLDQTTYDPNLKPEFTTETELGTELWFFKKRIGLDVTYYNRITTNLITPIAIPNATGYDQFFTNLGQISNKGWEIGLSLTPLSLKNGFNWNIYTTFTKNVSNIDELLPGNLEGEKNEVILANTYSGSVQAVFRKGYPYGMIKGTKAARDANGNFLINPNTGLTIEDPNPVLLGNPNPNFILGITNTFTFKGFTLSGVLDYKDGGVLYSSTTSLQLGRGVTMDTQERNHPFVVAGVLGNPNTFTPLLGADGKTIPNTIQVMANDLYFQSSGGSFATNAPDEFSVWDATTIRLREVNFGYSLPKKVLAKTPFGSASITFTGRNLFYKAVNFPKNSNFDPETNTFGTGNATGFEFSSAPSTRRYGVSLRFTF